MSGRGPWPPPKNTIVLTRLEYVCFLVSMLVVGAFAGIVYYSIAQGHTSFPAAFMALLGVSVLNYAAGSLWWTKS